jgi:hypothetical protein
MNVFWLAQDPATSARYHVTRHCPKMALEAAQVLSNVLPIGLAPYKRSHLHHPVCLWASASRANWERLAEQALAICHEYTFRYGKICKVQGVLEAMRPLAPNIQFADHIATPPPRCFGPYKGVLPETADEVHDYRLFYAVAKQHLHQWKSRPRPEWLEDYLTLAKQYSVN